MKKIEDLMIKDVYPMVLDFYKKRNPNYADQSIKTKTNMFVRLQRYFPFPLKEISPKLIRRYAKEKIKMSGRSCALETLRTLEDLFMVVNIPNNPVTKVLKGIRTPKKMATTRERYRILNSILSPLPLFKDLSIPEVKKVVPSPKPKSNYVDSDKVVEGIFNKIQEVMDTNKALKAEIIDLKEENHQLRTLAGKEQKKPLSVPSFLMSCPGD